MLELPHQGSDAMGSGKTFPKLCFLKNAAIQKLEDLMDADYLDGLKILKLYSLKWLLMVF